MPALGNIQHRLQENLLASTFDAAVRLKAAGKELFDLSIGDPDVDTPKPIKQAAVSAMNAGHTKYTSTDGTTVLKQAIMDKYAREHGLDYCIENIVCDAGAKPTLNLLARALLDPGDRVVMALPAYSCYFSIVALHDAELYGIPVHADQGFRLSPEQLDDALRTPSKMWLFNNPCNPTGVHYTRAELEAFAEVLRKYPDTWVVIDEVYEYWLYGNTPYHSLAAVAPDLQDQIVTVNSVSKSYAMTGWRLGFAIGNVSLMNMLREVMSASHTNPSTLSQAAAVEAMNGDHAHLSAWIQRFRSNRDFITQQLNIPRLDLVTPESGMFYLLGCQGLIGLTTPDGKLINDSSDLCRYLLEEYGVVCVPGIAFGLEPYFRISMVGSDDGVRKGVLAIREAIGHLRA